MKHERGLIPMNLWNQDFLSDANKHYLNKYFYEKGDNAMTYRKKTATVSDFTFKVKKVRFNGPVTVVTFDDDSIVKVRHNNDKTFNLETAILYAYFEKNFGKSKSAAHKELENLVADAEKASMERLNKKAKKEMKKIPSEENEVQVSFRLDVGEEVDTGIPGVTLFTNNPDSIDI